MIEDTKSEFLTRPLDGAEPAGQNGHSAAEVDSDPQETQEWLDSLEWTIKSYGQQRATFLLERLNQLAVQHGASLPHKFTTPYINSIPVKDMPVFPGDRQMERRIRNLIRWNAMAMVAKANEESKGIGGHISTYQSVAALFEVGFNHFFRATTKEKTGDVVYFQGHASPGVYARAFLEGRLSAKQLGNFRRELAKGGGLSSYPHPWLMPDFWQFPTVSMGIAPLTAIYQARFAKYLQQRGLMQPWDGQVWAFLGDGEMDEPESLGAIGVAVREKLDNLIFVVNCNLQRLDGPVRGNGKIIQELEGTFRGVGWNVIKVIWGDKWDALLDADKSGLLMKRMEEVVDGEYQKYIVEDGAYIREHFFGKYPELLKLVEHLSDHELAQLPRGGHDHKKVYAAYKAAVGHKGQPTVILAKTVKGYGMGEAGEGRNTAHNTKTMSDSAAVYFGKRFHIPISEKQMEDLELYMPPADSPEMVYLREHREKLGGSMPARIPRAPKLATPAIDFFDDYINNGTKGNEASTTMVFVRMLGQLLKHEGVGKFIVPIVPDESRTFGMEGLFNQAGIYAPEGQKYEPVDSKTLTKYREAADGQILQEGINEAGAMGSFIAAGSAYSTFGVNTIPFYIYYSMFGFQRTGDFIWAAADTRCKGFLLGGTAGRTTLNGEGLQHEDGHSHLLASTVPNCVSYDPAYAFELAVILEDGLRRMYGNNEEVFYYITLMNENYAHPPMPKGSEEGIRRGIYLLSKGSSKRGMEKVQLFGSGTILPQVMAAQELLAEKFNISADVWSVTSYNELRRDGMEAERHNRLNPDKKPRLPYISEVLKGAEGPVVAASDYMRVMSDGLRQWIANPLYSLGTDGFGRSESREALREFFEVNPQNIAATALYALSQNGGKLTGKQVAQAISDLGIDSGRAPAWKL